MNGHDFLRLVLPDQGWYVGHASKAVPGEDKPLIRHQSFASHEKLVRWLSAFDHNGFNCYYAVAAFEHETVRNEKTGKLSRRSRANEPWLADLFADIDTQESHPKAKYRDVQEAAEAVAVACRTVKIPLPLWVATGGGLHVHWPLAEAMHVDEWEIYAQGFKAALLRSGLAIDPSRTADACSILRAPGFTHQKTGRIVQCSETIKPFEIEIFEHLKGYVNVQDIRRRVATSPLAQSYGTVTAAMLGGLRDDPSNPALIGRNCQQVRQFIEQPGAYSEPMHRAIAGLCKNCHEHGGDQYLEWLSPDWREHGRAKLDGYNAGPTTCEHFRAISPEGCEGCQWKGKITSPIVLGREEASRVRTKTQVVQEKNTAQIGSQFIQIATVETESPPDLNGFPVLNPPWGLNRDNKLVMLAEAKGSNAPTETLVSEHPIYVETMNCSEGMEETSYTFMSLLPKEGWTKINVAASDMGLGHGIPVLMKKGALIRNKLLFAEYMNDQLGVVTRRAVRDMRFEQCGWKGPQFVFGRKLYGPAGQTDVVVNDELSDRIDRLGLGPTPGGDAREWVRGTSTLFQPDHHAAWFTIALGFGGILMPWHVNRGEGGAILSLFSPESGTGKTMITKAASSIWGQWDALAIKDHDTHASHGLILANLGNVPAFIDEFAHFVRDPQLGAVKLRTFIDIFCSGTDKHRAMPHGAGLRHQMHRWIMSLITNGNNSIVDLLEVFGRGVNAPAMRVLEFLLRPPSPFDQYSGSTLERRLWDNAGHAGDAFLKHLMRDGMTAFAKTALHDWTVEIWRSSELGPEQRFRMHLIGCAAVGGALARDCGLMPVEVKDQEYIAWAVDSLRSIVPATAARTRVSPGIDALNDFLKENVNNTLRVQNAYKRGTTQPVQARPNRLLVRHETGAGRVYVSIKDFRAFVVQNNYGFADVLKELAKLGVLRNDRRMMTLGAGTEFASAQVPCLEFEITGAVHIVGEQPDGMAGNA